MQTCTHIYTYLNNVWRTGLLYRALFFLRPKVDKPSKNFIITLNAIEYIKTLDIQNTKAPRTDDPIILVCMRKDTYITHLKEFLKLFMCLTSSVIHMISGWLGLFFNALHQERKEESREFSQGSHGHLKFLSSSPLLINISFMKFSQKPSYNFLYLPTSIDIMCGTL